MSKPISFSVITLYNHFRMLKNIVTHLFKMEEAYTITHLQQ